MCSGSQCYCTTALPTLIIAHKSQFSKFHILNMLSEAKELSVVTIFFVEVFYRSRQVIVDILPEFTLCRLWCINPFFDKESLMISDLLTLYAIAGLHKPELWNCHLIPWDPFWYPFVDKLQKCSPKNKCCQLCCYGRPHWLMFPLIESDTSNLVD